MMDLQSAWWVSWLEEDSENINMHFHVFSHAIYKFEKLWACYRIQLEWFQSLFTWHIEFECLTLFSDSNRLKVGRVKWSEAVGTQSQMPKTQSTQLRSLPFRGSKLCQLPMATRSDAEQEIGLEVEKWLAGRFCKRPSFADVLEFTCNLWVWQSQNGSRLFSHCIACSTVQPTNIHHPHVESTEPYPIAVVQLGGRPREALENMWRQGQNE